MTFEVICKQGNGESSALAQQVKYVFFFMLVRLVFFANIKLGIRIIDIWMNAAMDVTNETQTVRPNRIRKDVYIITLMDVMYNSCPSKRSQSAIC